MDYIKLFNRLRGQKASNIDLRPLYVRQGLETKTKPCIKKPYNVSRPAKGQPHLQKQHIYLQFSKLVH